MLNKNPALALTWTTANKRWIIFCGLIIKRISTRYKFKCQVTVLQADFTEKRTTGLLMVLQGFPLSVTPFSCNRLGVRSTYAQELIIVIIIHGIELTNKLQKGNHQFVMLVCHDATEKVWLTMTIPLSDLIVILGTLSLIIVVMR